MIGLETESHRDFEVRNTSFPVVDLHIFWNIFISKWQLIKKIRVTVLQFNMFVLYLLFVQLETSHNWALWHIKSWFKYFPPPSPIQKQVWDSK